MSNRINSTRRGFLRGSLGSAAATGACGRPTPQSSVGTVGAPEGVAHDDRVPVRTTINGVVRQLEVTPERTVLNVVREQLGLTGAKLGCGHGACGACAMHLDGTSVSTCMLPATALHGRDLTTVEALGAPKLHPVQAAFIAHDALQCGYCTPGFVVAASEFVDRWQRERGRRSASRDEVAAALAGHLCRCGSYEQIYAAVGGACRGDFDHDRDPDAPRHEARDKVTGAARYTVDVALPGMLHAVALYSPHAHAVVERLDWSRALALPGVRGAVDLRSPTRTVRFAGQEIMALAAVDEATAQRALAQVEVEYDVRPAVVDLDAARAAGAPLVYPGRSRRRPTNASEVPLVPQRWNGNVRGPLRLLSKAAGAARRRVEIARADGQLSEATWRASTQCHTVLEPHAAVAQWTGEALVVHMSTQAVRQMAHDIAERWGLKRDNVRVIAQHVGGGFGGKANLTHEVVIAVELARVCGAPVRYVQDRRAEMSLGGNRPGCAIELAVATTAKGELRGMTSTAYSSAGSAVGSAVSVLHRLIYPNAPRELADYDVVTHTPPGKPFRAPGGPQAAWALEQAVDELAAKLSTDPVALRRSWDPNPGRNVLYDWVEQLGPWRDRARPQADKGRYRRGLGLACGAWFCFQEPKSRVQIDAGPDGIRATQSSQDIGNGTRSTIAKTIADAFGLRMTEVDVDLGDSRYVHGPMAAGSRCTSSVVAPTMDAVEQLQDELVELAERRFGVRGARADVSGVVHEAGTIPWPELLSATPPISVVGRRKRDRGGNFLPPIAGVAIERAVSASVQVVEVEVDARLGRVRAVEAWGGFAVGKIVSPILARSIASGGILQGVSYALYEQMLLDPQTGVMLTGGLEDYRILGIGDAPQVHVHFDETGYRKIRGHAVGLAELTTVAVPAAIGNAVFDATGWRAHDLPLRLDRVAKGLGQ